LRSPSVRPSLSLSHSHTHTHTHYTCWGRRETTLGCWPFTICSMQSL
jgi:hypothetical protein